MDSNVTLPFDSRKQLAVLGHLVLNDRFFRLSHGKIRAEWFNDPRAGRLYKFQCNYLAKHGRAPTFDELWSCPDIMSEPTLAEQKSLQGILQLARTETAAFGLDAIRSELTQWLHARMFTEGVSKAVQLYNSGKFAESYDIVWNRINDIRTTTFEEEAALAFSNPLSYLQASELSYERALTTGLTILDDALVPGNDSKGRGGLFRGDITILMAPANVGKTTCLITMAVKNAMQGKKVLFMTHEGRPSDIREKMLQCALRMEKGLLFEAYKSPEMLQRLDFFATHLDKFLTYVPYNKAGMTVEEVIPIIRRRQEQLVAAGHGGYDMIVSDYPAKLSTLKAAGGHLQQRHIDAIVYENYVQLALELDCHVVAAVQTNRQGSISNRDDERLLTMEDVAESWGVMTAATNVLTLNRDQFAALNNRLTFYVAKSRSSEVGRAIVARTAYAKAITHDDELGGTWYRGSNSMSDKIDDLLAKYNGKSIPDIAT